MIILLRTFKLMGESKKLNMVVARLIKLKALLKLC